VSRKIRERTTVATASSVGTAHRRYAARARSSSRF
jgi:hypothetical protein